MQLKSQITFCLLSFGRLPVSASQRADVDCITDNYNMNENHINDRRPEGRFLTFNNDESSLRIEINFAIPFLQIPIGGRSKTLEGADSRHPVVDVNAKSLVTASAFIFTVLYVIPKLIKLFIPQMSRLSKLSGGDNELVKLIHNFELTMGAMNIDADSCWQRSVCSTVQMSARKVNSGAGTSWDKIIDGLSRNEVFNYMINGSSTYEGIKSAMKDDYCHTKYKHCQFDMKDAIHFFRKLYT